MHNLDKSDYMLCTNSVYLQYKDRKTNDGIFVSQMSRTRPQCIRDIDKENNLFITASSRVTTCGKLLDARGGNSLGCEPVLPCPNLFGAYSLNEFLLVPCQKNTYRNYQVFDDVRQCSKSHQVLNNWTKRKEITGTP